MVGGHDKGTGLPDFSEVWPDEGDVGAPASLQLTRLCICASILQHLLRVKVGAEVMVVGADMFELAETLYDAGYEYMLMRTLSPCSGCPAVRYWLASSR